ncbi:MAG: ferric reductase-like transmembrane domain-containing protein [Chloroflexi bacterium]|nr:ferric reductase-like transmembrane domain-containing protein [Chloroflexota bacterium]
MSTQSAIRASNQPLGGASGDWSHRFLRFHLPFALVSALVLVVFNTFPLFDTNAYPHVDIRSGAFPQRRERMGGGPAGVVRPGEDETVQQRERGGGGPMAPMPSEHGGGQAAPSEHGGGQAAPTDRGGDRAARMGEGEMMGMGRNFFLGLSMRQWTVGTGYVATGLLGLTLLIGPANLLLRRRNPVSSYWRRDAGTWTAIVSVVHVIFGFQVEGSLTINGILNYFFAPDGSPLTNSFGWGNWTGLAATVIVLVLQVLSTDAALREFKARTWKNLQRLNYALFALVIAHAIFYGGVVRQESPYTLLLILSVIAVFVGQGVGVWLWRRRYSCTTASQAA